MSDESILIKYAGLLNQHKSLRDGIGVLYARLAASEEEARTLRERLSFIQRSADIALRTVMP